MNTNCMFPYICYDPGHSNFEWGLKHGEEFRNAITELCDIRKHLMLAKNPKLLNKINSLADEQFFHSKKFAPMIAMEIEGIAKGANLPLSDLVILNNYTDFRDIILPDEGCSSVHIQTASEIMSGQTWDMHKSAKNYMCLIHIPPSKNLPAQLILSLVGCVGLMGVTTNNNFVGVNNINTMNARPGVIWPLLVRKILEQQNLGIMRETLLNAPVTSGHNYLISSPEGGEHHEVTPTLFEKVSALQRGQEGSIFHTNHCVGVNIEKLEDKTSMSSTTINRWELLSKKTHLIKDIHNFKDLLTNHDEFPKSLCSHFENGSQDPSFTCGGGVSDLIRGRHIFWRGCPAYDKDYREHQFVLSENNFLKV